jgi:XTP/dITP diphosphohydrolase
MKELYLVTKNEDKLMEIKDILKLPIKIANIEVDEVQSMDLEYVARRKAQAAFEQIGKPIVVDDVGFYIDALNGFPGPFAKYFLQTLGNVRLLELLKKEENRRVVVKSAVGYHDGKKIHVFVGEVRGTLSTEERGEDGWGFDFIIIPDGHNKTYAELGSSIKNTISHRRKAFDLLKNYLDSQK